MTKEYPKRAIALVADTHVGSRYALFPKKFYSEQEGNELRLNKGQRRLLKYWNSFLETCDEFEVDSVILDGDMMNAVNRREFGRYQMTTNLEEQIAATVELCEPLCRDRSTYVFDGTGYHESLDSRMHKHLADKLGGKHMGGLANLKFSGRRFNITHGTSAAFVYRAGRMERDAYFQKWAEALGKVPKVDVLVKAHWHQFFHIHANQQHIIQIPCWQGFVPWDKALGNYARYQPDIGGIIVTLDEQARIRVLHFLYPVVHIGIADVEA